MYIRRLLRHEVSQPITKIGSRSMSLSESLEVGNPEIQMQNIIRICCNIFIEILMHKRSLKILKNVYLVYLKNKKKYKIKIYN